MSRILAGLLAGFMLIGSAMAQHTHWPTRPLRLVVPYPAGGSTDQLARAIAERLGAALGQPVLVENKPGANTIIGADAVAKAAPDGYTLFMGSGSNLTINPSLYANLPYDPVRDFAPVSIAASSPLVLVVHPDVPANNVREFIALAKAQPGVLNFASVGNGNPLHLAAELFKTQAGIDMTHIPYAGTAPAMTALLGGQVQIMFDVVLTSAPHIKAGKLRALGVTGPRRVAVLPEVPTLSEAGFPGFDVFIWFGIVVPKATPASIVARLNAEIVKILSAPEMKDRFDPLALELSPSTPQEMTAFMARETARWAKVIKDFNIKLEQ